MARRCYKLNLNGVDYKLRLTLAGQKAIRERDPETPILAALMSALDDPDEMDFILSTALNWDGNENKITSGEALYDEMVDAGYRGNEKFLEVILGIAHNAGLLSDDERDKVRRSTLRILKQTMDNLDGGTEEEEGEESPENPLDKLETLDG
jgi:hypothetical protein